MTREDGDGYSDRLRREWRTASPVRKVATLVVSVAAVAILVIALLRPSKGGTPFGNEALFRLVQLVGTVVLVLLARRSLRRK